MKNKASKTPEQKKRDLRNKRRREKRTNKLVTPKTKSQNEKNIEILKKRGAAELKKIQKDSKFNGITANTPLKPETVILATCKPNGSDIKVQILPEIATISNTIPIGPGDFTPKIDGLKVDLGDNITVNFKDEKPAEVFHSIEFIPKGRGILRDFKSKFEGLGKFIQDVYNFTTTKFLLFKVKYLSKTISRS